MYGMHSVRTLLALSNPSPFIKEMLHPQKVKFDSRLLNLVQFANNTIYK